MKNGERWMIKRLINWLVSFISNKKCGNCKKNYHDTEAEKSYCANTGEQVKINGYCENWRQK